MSDVIDGQFCFSLQLKPVGSNCNLRCDYCYVEPFRGSGFKVMSHEILEKTISSCLNCSYGATITWHGGEPLLAGYDFFLKAVEYIDQYRQSTQAVRNIVQTNATLLTDGFARLFKKNDFGISISLDGPSTIHDMHRKSRDGRNSFNDVISGLKILREAGVCPSVIATVTRDTLPYAGEVFDFLVEIGFKQIKFSPVFDSLCDKFSITSDEWFLYLSEIFKKWYGLENPDVHIRDLDEVIAWFEKETLLLCSVNQSCLNWVSVDPEGNLYPCEYLRSSFSYGNILNMNLSEIFATKSYQRFKSDFFSPPEECQLCEFYNLCGNGCPATRIINNKINPRGLYVYCNQRRQLFQLIKGTFEAELSRNP